MMNPGSPQWLTRRRALLLQMLSLGAALGGCGGGGGGDAAPTTPTPPSPPPPPPPTPSGPRGSLVYRNSGLVGIYNFATGTELQFDPGSSPFIDPGVSVSRDGLISASLAAPGNGDFALGFYGLDGKAMTTYTVTRDGAFQTSAVSFNADATRIAFSVDEPISPSNSTRDARTLIYTWPAGTPVAVLDGYEVPMWAGSAGELLVRDPQTLQLRLFNANLLDQGWLPNLTVSNLYGGIDVSRDGRYVLSENLTRIVAYDRSTGTSWTAVEDATAVTSTHSPTLSPDGRHLALLARDLLNFVPHVVPFAAGSTVDINSVQALSVGLADCSGRMGWTT